MNRILYRSACALLFSTAAIATTHAQVPATPEARATAIEQGLQRAIQIARRPAETSSITERMEALRVPAVSVAAIHDGRIDWARAWGDADVESGRAATTGTLFQAASMSKPIAALAALVMVDAGDVALDEDVNSCCAGSAWASRSMLGVRMSLPYGPVSVKPSHRPRAAGCWGDRRDWLLRRLPIRRHQCRGGRTSP